MKTSKADFRFYVAECQRLIKLWGLNDWLVEYEHRKNDEARAWCAGIPEHRQMVIGLATEWETPVSRGALRDTAFHETAHLLLAPITHMAHPSRRKTTREWETTVEMTTRKVQAAIEAGRCR